MVPVVSHKAKGYISGLWCTSCLNAERGDDRIICNRPWSRSKRIWAPPISAITRTYFNKANTCMHVYGEVPLNLRAT